MIRSATPEGPGQVTVGHRIHGDSQARSLVDAQSLPQYDDDPPWPYGQALSRIWPVKQPVVHWPPSQHVTTRVFDKLVNWG